MPAMGCLITNCRPISWGGTTFARIDQTVWSILAMCLSSKCGPVAQVVTGTLELSNESTNAPLQSAGAGHATEYIASAATIGKSLPADNPESMAISSLAESQ
jgi:hypothetical protein